MAKASLPKSAPSCQVPTVSPSDTSQHPGVPDVIPHYLPGGGLSLLAGAPGVGKTALLAGLLRDIRDGRAIFGHTLGTRPPAIGFINSDRSWDKGAGIWFGRVGYPDIRRYSIADDPTFSAKRLRKRFERTDLLCSFIDQLALPPGSLINVDPVSIFLGGNLLDYDTCYVASQEIRAYLRQKQYTLLGTAHSSKLKTNKQDRYLRMQDQILGSTALLGFSDTQMYLASPEELGKSYYAFLWHPHGAKSEVHYLDRDEQGLFLSWTGVDQVAQSQLIAYIPDDGTAIEFGALVDAAQAVPLSRRTVKNIIDSLMERGVIERAGHGKYRRVTLQ